MNTLTAWLLFAFAILFGMVSLSVAMGGSGPPCAPLAIAFSFLIAGFSAAEALRRK